MATLYEIVTIINPDETDDGVDAIIGGLRQAVINAGGEVLAVDKWGRRKLAYPIKKHTEGFYVLMHVEGPAKLPNEYRAYTRIRESILRELVVKLEEAHEKVVRAQLAEKGPEDEKLAAEQIAAAEQRAADKRAALTASVSEAAEAEGEAEQAEAAPGAEAPEADSAEAAVEAEAGEPVSEEAARAEAEATSEPAEAESAAEQPEAKAAKEAEADEPAHAEAEPEADAAEADQAEQDSKED